MNEPIGQLRVRSPKDPLTPQEQAVFGHGACRHGITGYPIESGSTDHSTGDGKPPSDDAQALRHFEVMLGELRKLCRHHDAEVAAEKRARTHAGHEETAHRDAEAAARKKAQLRADHALTAAHVSEVAAALIDAGILDKGALNRIPQIQ